MSLTSSIDAHTQVPLLQKAKGYLYPVYGRHPIMRTVEYNAIGPRTLHGFLPLVNGKKIFIPVPPPVPGPSPRFKINTTILTCYDDRFIVLHYSDYRGDSPLNESLVNTTKTTHLKRGMAIGGTPRIPWKGEIAIIPLGTRVPFLSKSVKRARLNQAVAL